MPSENLSEFRTRLNDLINGGKYPSIRAAAHAAGVAHTTLYDMLKGYVEPSERTLAALARAFPENAAELWRLTSVPVPPALECPPYCELASAIAAKLGVSKEEAIQRAVDRMAESLAVAA